MTQATNIPLGPHATMRERSRDELVGLCMGILQNDPWDENAVWNCSHRLADLLIELTGTAGVEPCTIEHEVTWDCPASQATQAKNTVDCVAEAICDSTEADRFSELPENSIMKAIYRQQAEAAIEAYKKSQP